MSGINPVTDAAQLHEIIQRLRNEEDAMEEEQRYTATIKTWDGGKESSKELPGVVDWDTDINEVFMMFTLNDGTIHYIPVHSITEMVLGPEPPIISTACTCDPNENEKCDSC